MSPLQCGISLASPFSLLAAWTLVAGLVGHGWRGRKIEQWREDEHDEGKAMYRIREGERRDGQIREGDSRVNAYDPQSSRRTTVSSELLRDGAERPGVCFLQSKLMTLA